MSLGKLMAACLCLVACKEKPTIDSTKPYVYPNAPPPQAEVEYSGQWVSNAVVVKEAKLQIQAEPCASKSEHLKVFESKVIDGPGRLSGEIFVPQKTAVHFCLFGFDAQSKLVAIGNFSKNPIVLEGQGEVIVSDVVLSLQLLAP
jgi:hypothetical protein